jgi:hypothetical protein
MAEPQPHRWRGSLLNKMKGQPGRDSDPQVSNQAADQQQNSMRTGSTGSLDQHNEKENVGNLPSANPAKRKSPPTEVRRKTFAEKLFNRMRNRPKDSKVPSRLRQKQTTAMVSDSLLRQQEESATLIQRQARRSQAMASNSKTSPTVTPRNQAALAAASQHTLAMVSDSKLKRQLESAVRIQSLARQRSASAQVGDKQSARQRGAAVAIQSHSRAGRARAELAGRQDARKESIKAHCAVRIQSRQRQRGAAAAVQASQLQRQEGAALAIQSRQRQRQAQGLAGATRCMAQAEAQWEHAERESAAKTIQCRRRQVLANQRVEQERGDANTADFCGQDTADAGPAVVRAAADGLNDGVEGFMWNGKKAYILRPPVPKEVPSLDMRTLGASMQKDREKEEKEAEAAAEAQATADAQAAGAADGAGAAGAAGGEQDAGDSVVLEEVIDPDYEPTQAEVVEYADWLGMDAAAHPDLLWIAKEGLVAPLPAQWKPCKTKDTEEVYYFNFKTGESLWDHPKDKYYLTLYEEHEKKKSGGAVDLELLGADLTDKHREQLKQ